MKNIFLLLLTIVTLQHQIAEAQSLLMNEGSRGIGIYGGVFSNFNEYSSNAFAGGASVNRKADLIISVGNSKFHDENNNIYKSKVILAQVTIFPSKEWEGDPVTIESTIGFGRSDFETLSNKAFGFGMGVSKNLLGDEYVFRPRISFGISVFTGDLNSEDTAISFDTFLGQNLFFFVPSITYSFSENISMYGFSAVFII